MIQSELFNQAPEKLLSARQFTPSDRRFVKFPRRVILAVRRRRQIPVSEWSEKYRVVPADSPIPGYWRNTTTPYLVGIMDSIMTPSVQHVVVCAPPQTGKTDLSLNVVGYTADRMPGNWLIVYPDEKTAGDMSRDRVQPMFKDSPRLRRYLTGAVDDLATLRITLKHARIYMAWATSAARLASRPLPYVLLDEVDKFPVTAGRKETAPTTLAEKRTRTFGHRRKIIRVSTPTIESGPIWQALKTECEAVFVYWVRCPDCEAWQEMEFTSIKWNGGSDADPRIILSDQKSTMYECTACGSAWDDARRDVAVAAGGWRDRDEGIALNTYLETRRPVVIGFHYRAWISRFVPLREVAAAFLRAQSDRNKLKDFQNDYNAEPWRLYKEDRIVDNILALIEDRPRGVVPAGGVVSTLTAGVDTQDSGFWFWVHAWGYADPGHRPDSWCVRAGFVTDFAALEQVLWLDAYLDVDRQQYVISMALQDALGHRTAEVYDFVRAHPGKILPSYGRAKLAAPYSYSNQQHYPGGRRPIRGGLRAVNVNTKYFKDEVAAALTVAPGDPGGIGLYSDFPTDFAHQLVAEYVNDAGAWECPPGKANHLWDCLVLNFCAAEIIGTRHRAKPERLPEVIHTTTPATSGGTWLRPTRDGDPRSRSWFNR
jgi:phage terminase large subunit GpA-like protein